MTEAHDESRFPRSTREAWPEADDWIDGPYTPASFSLSNLILFAVVLGLAAGALCWWLLWT